MERLSPHESHRIARRCGPAFLIENGKSRLRVRKALIETTNVIERFRCLGEELYMCAIQAQKFLGRTRLRKALFEKLVPIVDHLQERLRWYPRPANLGTL